MTRVPSSGWHVEVVHPDTGRTITPDILDDPAILPSLNSLPEVRVPVRKSDLWLDPGFNDDPTMDVWLDGEKQPIDILERVEERQDRVILVGVGATELRTRVQAEYRNERRYRAAETLIQNEVTYADDVDTPVVTTRTDEVVQTLTTTAEFDANTDLDATDPVDTSGDEVKTLQTSFTVDDALFSSVNGATSFNNVDGYNDGTYHLFDTVGQWLEVEFTNAYEMPKSDLDVWIRAETEGVGEEVTFTATIDGEETESDRTVTDGIEWEYLDTLGPDLGTGTLDPGTHTVRIEVADIANSGDAARVDLINVSDNRFNYTFDNTLSSAQGYLDGPEDYPDEQIVSFADFLSPFAITGGSAAITIDDTSNSQFMQVSNDFGDNWLPTGGTEDNTSSVDVTFADDGAAIRLRVGISRHSPSGARSQTPRLGYDPQSVSDTTLRADIEESLLLVDQQYDDALIEVLNDIASSKFIWSANLDANGNYQISWTQPGQRTAASDPDISDVTISKNADIYDQVTIFGSNSGVTNETFTAQAAFQSLANTDLVTGSETVYDASGTNFDRGGDYEMDYSNGEIRAVAGGDLSTGTDYTINYSVQVSGTYPESVSNPAREFVDRVPGVVSERGAGQIAYVLQTDNDTPIYSADVQIPREDVSFDPLDALTLDAFDLPSEATPLETRGEPEISPTGIRLRLGSRSTIEESLGAIASTVSSLSKRS